jgi:hypothetical protein
MIHVVFVSTYLVWQEGNHWGNWGTSRNMQEQKNLVKRVLLRIKQR